MSEVKERPIIFYGPMVRAILEGRKTQTRRITRFSSSGRIELHGRQWHISDPNAIRACPYGQPGDRLWVRETWCRTAAGYTQYRADDKREQPYWTLLKWKPSIHMPRLASRITLEITDVRVERLQDITHRDALSEGVEYDVSKQDGSPLSRFENLWNSINAKRGYSWESNPFVWVLSFNVVTHASKQRAQADPLRDASRAA